MTEDEVRRKLQQRVDKTRNLTALCNDEGICRSHLYEFLRGNRGPSAAILDFLGLEYRIVRKANAKNRKT